VGKGSQKEVTGDGAGVGVPASQRCAPTDGEAIPSRPRGACPHNGRDRGGNRGAGDHARPQTMGSTVGSTAPRRSCRLRPRGRGHFGREAAERDKTHPCAAASGRKGMADTLTVLRPSCADRTTSAASLQALQALLLVHLLLRGPAYLGGHGREHPRPGLIHLLLHPLHLLHRIALGCVLRRARGRGTAAGWASAWARRPRIRPRPVPHSG